jgi:hypothetical protein
MRNYYSNDEDHLHKEYVIIYDLVNLLNQVELYKSLFEDYLHIILYN